MRPVVPYTLVLSSQRSRPFFWPVILDVLALLFCMLLTTVPMMFPVLWQVSRSSWFTPGNPKSSLASPGFCSGGVAFALVQPVVPYIPVLSSQRLPGGIFGSLLTGSLPRFLPQGGSSSFESSSLLLKLKVIPKRPRIPHNTTIFNRCPL